MPDQPPENAEQAPRWGRRAALLLVIGGVLVGLYFLPSLLERLDELLAEDFPASAKPVSYQIQATARPVAGLGENGGLSSADKPRYEFRLFIDANEASLDAIESVTYYLTALRYEKEPVRQGDPEQHFEVRFQSANCLESIPVRVELKQGSLPPAEINLCDRLGKDWQYGSQGVVPTDSESSAAALPEADRWQPPETSALPEIRRAPSATRSRCGIHWGQWGATAGERGNPCPEGCKPWTILTVDTRFAPGTRIDADGVERPKVQTRERIACR